jgi:hypothetical protein
VLLRESRGKQFVISPMFVFPEPDAGVGKRLGWVVGGDTCNLNPFGEFTRQQLLEDVIKPLR